MSATGVATGGYVDTGRHITRGNGRLNAEGVANGGYVESRIG